MYILYKGKQKTSISFTIIYRLFVQKTSFRLEAMHFTCFFSQKIIYFVALICYSSFVRVFDKWESPEVQLVPIIVVFFEVMEFIIQPVHWDWYFQSETICILYYGIDFLMSRVIIYLLGKTIANQLIYWSTERAFIVWLVVVGDPTNDQIADQIYSLKVNFFKIPSLLRTI